MVNDDRPTDREIRIARVLRPLGTKPMTRSQAVMAGKLLGLHWTSVYRLRRRFLGDPVASSVAPMLRGPNPGDKRVAAPVEQIIADVLTRWLPKQRELAHPQLDTWMEIRRRCLHAALPAPARNTVARRLAEHRDTQAALLADEPGAQIPPGNFVAAAPLEIVQIDHTQSDVEVVDDWFRRAIGRPWLSVAIDIATRCVVAVYVAMERPNAGTVALLLSRVALAKGPWLASIGVESDWPMRGLPKVLHLDNASEFKSRALRSGCGQYGIELMYRPVGRPQFGGHVERMNRTLMQRLKGLPGTTGNSTVGRKARQSADRAALSLSEFGQWLALEVAQRYHHSPHRGLMGATPASAWASRSQSQPPRLLPAGPDEALQFLVRFMPMASRTIQADGLTLFHLRYWHPIFAAWRVSQRKVVVRYHPEDLSRIFVSKNGKEYLEARFADLRRPPISLWEQRAALRLLRAQGNPDVSERLIFAAIEKQRQIVAAARRETKHARRQSEGKRRPPKGQQWAPPAQPVPSTSDVDYSRPAEPFPVEIWESPWHKR
jgi:putative transposase